MCEASGPTCVDAQKGSPSFKDRTLATCVSREQSALGTQFARRGGWVFPAFFAVFSFSFFLSPFPRLARRRGVRGEARSEFVREGGVDEDALGRDASLSGSHERAESVPMKCLSLGFENLGKGRVPYGSCSLLTQDTCFIVCTPQSPESGWR